MAKYIGDAGLLREAVAYAGVKLYDDKVFSDGNKGTRRLKIWRAEELFEAEPEVQEKFMERLKHNFGNRVIKYYPWISTHPYNFQSFVLVVTEDEALQKKRSDAYIAAYEAGKEKRKAKYDALFAKTDEVAPPVCDSAWLPQADHVEYMYFIGYQGARDGMTNRYEVGSINYALWQAGADAFHAGKELFAK